MRVGGESIPNSLAVMESADGTTAKACSNKVLGAPVALVDGPTSLSSGATPVRLRSRSRSRLSGGGGSAEIGGNETDAASDRCEVLGCRRDEATADGTPLESPVILALDRIDSAISAKVPPIGMSLLAPVPPSDES